MLPPIIQASRLDVRFERPGQFPVPALNGLDLSIAEGEFVAVIGSSGAGKTTLLRCLTGFVRPSAGRLIVDGTDVVAARRSELYRLRRRVATIYQHFNLVERASALENTLHGRLGHVRSWRGLLGVFPPRDQTLAYETLIDLGLGERALQRVDRLSGGERQRVAIARALVQAPRIVLADEPAASLDVALTRLVIETLHEQHRRSGLTVLVNMHDLELAKSHATRVVGLRHGVKVFDGATSDLNDEIVSDIYDREAAPERRHGDVPREPAARPLAATPAS
jgi:phosphonate transport system ATP-binding protein